MRTAGDHKAYMGLPMARSSKCSDCSQLKSLGVNNGATVYESVLCLFSPFYETNCQNSILEYVLLWEYYMPIILFKIMLLVYWCRAYYDYKFLELLVMQDGWHPLEYPQLIFFSSTWRGVSILHSFEIQIEMEMRRMRCCVEKMSTHLGKTLWQEWRPAAQHKLFSLELLKRYAPVSVLYCHFTDCSCPLVSSW